MRKKSKKDFNGAIFFHEDKKHKFTGFDALASLIDNSVTTVYIRTPKGWKCKKKGCRSTFMHSHSTYDVLRSTLNS